MIPSIPFMSSNLQQRLISSCVLIPLVLFCIFHGGWLFNLGVIGAMTVSLYEWLRLVNPAAHPFVKGATYAVLLLALCFGAWQSAAFGLMLAMVLSLPLFVVAYQDNQAKALWVVAGIPYLVGGGLALMSLRQNPAFGVALTVYCMIVVWATDVGAYIAGRTIGGPKLMPMVSPKKTWAGLFGGIGLAGALGFVSALCFGSSHLLAALGLAFMMAIVSQGGDLFESFVKRRFDAKDSGDLIPGHGGMLDRIDGLLFAAMFFVLFGVCFGYPMG